MPEDFELVVRGATSPNRDSQLFVHLAQVLPSEGIAILRYDRRPSRSEDDVPFALQAEDALAAVDLLREHLGEAPVGLWAFRQGTWPATLAAATHPKEIAFLALVAGPGMSPAEQMRYGTREQVRRAGYDDRAQAETVEVWSAFESYLRGELSRENAQAIIDAYAGARGSRSSRRFRPSCPRTRRGTTWTSIPDRTSSASDARCTCSAAPRTSGRRWTRACKCGGNAPSRHSR
jgi:pimeloyl-ACP methyl ester carboxylesterase